MMGTSLLSMPWGINNAGPIPAIVIMLLMLSICFYSAYLILNSPKKLENYLMLKFSSNSSISSSADQNDLVPRSDVNANKYVKMVIDKVEEFSDVCY